MSVATLRPDSSRPYHSKRRHIDNDPERCSEHLFSAFKELTHLRRNSLFCDVVLETESGGEVAAHRVVLASRCSYFRAMFMCGTRETWADRIRLRGITLKTLDTVVSFLYNEKVRITGEEVQEILSAAEMMGLPDLKRMSLQFMSSHITVSNCLAVWQVSELYSSNVAVAEARSFALKHFTRVVETPEFLQLPPDKVGSLLGDDLLRVAHERSVLKALTAWLRHDEEGRRKQMPELLKCVRFHLFGSADFVKAITSNSCPETLPPLETALTHHLDPCNRAVCTVAGPPQNPDRRRVVNELAIVIGGHQENSIWSKTWGCDVSGGRDWYALPSPHTLRRDHVAVRRGCDVIVAGGSDGTDHINRVERYDAYKGQWQELPAMLHPRNHLTGAELNGAVVVGGGTNDTCSYLSSMELLDLGSMRWQALPELSQPRRSCAAATVNNQIVIAGGAGQHCSALSTVELYDPREGNWRAGPALNTGRRGFGLVSVNECVYAIGGYTSEGYTDSIERLDLRKGKWVEYASLPVKVGYFGCSVTSSNQVLVCGGVSNNQLIAWDPATQDHVVLSTGPAMPYSGSITVCGVS